MKKVLSLILFVVVSSATLTLPSGAAPFNYQPFGNWNVGDCFYAAEANLTVHEFPNSVVTQADVVGAWRTYGEESEYLTLHYFETVGYAGHTVSVAPVFTRSQFIAGANAGGELSTVSNLKAIGLATADLHEVAVVHANHVDVTFISWGVEYIWPWRFFTQLDPHYLDAHQGIMDTEAVTWAAAVLG